jgi:hypothetical protein
MADVKQLQIGNTVYDICDADSRTSLAGKQNTISDLSTIRSNASTGATNATTAINRLNNFDITYKAAKNSAQVTFAAGPAAGRLGTAKTITLDDKTAPSGYTFLGATGFNPGAASLIVQRVYYSGGNTILYSRKVGTGTVTVAIGDANSKDVYIKLG